MVSLSASRTIVLRLVRPAIDHLTILDRLSGFTRSAYGKADNLIAGRQAGLPCGRDTAIVPPSCQASRLRRFNAEKSPASWLKRGRQSPGGEEDTGYKTNAQCSLFVPTWPYAG